MRAFLMLAAATAWLASCTAAPRREAGEPPVSAQSLRQLSFGVGPRLFDEEEFGNLDDHFALTLDYREPIGLAHLRLEGGFAYTHDEASGMSGGESVRLEADTYELSVGVNAALELGRVRPYAGVGGSILWLEVLGIDDELDLAFDDEDSTFGGYVEVGLLFEITPSSHVGLEYRHFEGSDASFDGSELETSYDQVVVVFGTSFVTADPNPPHPARDY